MGETGVAIRKLLKIREGVAGWKDEERENPLDSPTAGHVEFAADVAQSGETPIASPGRAPENRLRKRRKGNARALKQEC